MTTDRVKALVFALRSIHVRAEKLSDGITANQVFQAHWKAAYHRELKRVFGKDEAEIIAALGEADRIEADARVSDGIRQADILALVEAVEPIRAKAIALRDQRFAGAEPAERLTSITASFFALADFRRMRKEAFDDAVNKCV